MLSLLRFLRFLRFFWKSKKTWLFTFFFICFTRFLELCGRGSNPTSRFPPCYKWTSKRRKTLSQWVEPSERKPHTAGWPIPVRTAHMHVLKTVYNCGTQTTQCSTEHFWQSSPLSSRQSSQLRWCLSEGRGSTFDQILHDWLAVIFCCRV